MNKFLKLLLAVVIGLSFVPSTLSGYYIKGNKYYIKYVRLEDGIKCPKLIKKLGAKKQSDLVPYFENDGKKLFTFLENMKVKTKDPKMVYKINQTIKGLRLIQDRGALNDVLDFLQGLMVGNIPAGCA
jgi:hypothetical protein